MKPNIAVVGLRVMGSNLARNIESRGYHVAVYNRDETVRKAFGESVKGKNFFVANTLEELVANMERPRQILLMIQAGSPVDLVLEQLLPIVEPGDLIIDGGNSWFLDTQRREVLCKQKGVFFLGLGVSGGEEGALKGPSLMPGGAKEAWQIIAPMLEKIAAQADGPCTTYIGPDGAGHFVKMVHNGIEYGDMQLIAEAYHLLKSGAKKTSPELATIFEEWNRGTLQSFLIEITATCLKKKDEQGDGYLVDKILDKAGQKGTGKWTATVALDLGVSIPTLAAAVDARVLSSQKEDRQVFSKAFNGQEGAATVPPNFVETVRLALYASKILSYAQGLDLLAKASDHYKWNLQLGAIAAIWKGGCIIRARFLDEIRKAYDGTHAPLNLILAPAIKKELESALPALRETIALGVQLGIPMPAFSASLAYFDSLKSAELPQNLTQAQRDFFGAHTYERKDAPGHFVHTQWES